MNVRNDLLRDVGYGHLRPEDNSVVSKTEKNDNNVWSGFGTNSDKANDAAVIYSVSKVGLERAKDGYAVAKVSAANISNQQYQAYLSALGFYSGAMDGNMNSQASKNAIKNFQKVYGLSENGSLNSSTKGKLESAYSSYNSVYTSNSFATLNSNFNLDYSERVNFARTWAFLRVGMGLRADQASAVMGNFEQESRFASDNASDSRYPGDHNGGYPFRTNDGIAYGLAQWAFSSRKQGLQNTANSMGLSVSDINAQLAYIRSEATGSYSSAWNSFKNGGSVGNMTEIFYNRFEQANDGTADKRKGYANTIFNYLSNY